MSLDAMTLALAKSYTNQHSGGGGQVQPDWNQNDSTAADYVKNRPFYTGDPVETVLVEDINVSFSNPHANIYYGSIPTTIELIAGDTYKVSWDGATYECVCGLIMGNNAIGNSSIMGAGADTGEPFLILPLADNQGTEVYTLDTSASHTISISSFVAAEVVQIPDKYISDTFRDVVIAGNPLMWSEDDWTKYYGLFQSGKLLMINGIGSSDSEGYVLSMFYMSSARNMSAVSSTGALYKLGFNNDSEEDKFYWVPIINLGAFYFNYMQTGSGISTIEREVYKRLEASDVLTFTTKNANENPINRKVVLEGDKEIILSSSTADSTKKFKITVDDSGTLTAKEITTK